MTKKAPGPTKASPGAKKTIATTSRVNPQLAATKQVTKAPPVKKRTSDKSDDQSQAPATKRAVVTKKAAAKKAPVAKNETKKAAAKKATTTLTTKQSPSATYVEAVRDHVPHRNSPASVPVMTTDEPAAVEVGTEAEAASIHPERTRDEWADVNRDLFIERIRLQKEFATLSEILPEARTPAISRQIRRVRRDIDDITNKIVQTNYGLLRRYVRKFTQNARREDAQDFESAGLVGLMRAIDRYDPEKGRFAQWAFKPIQREVLRAVHGADHQNMNPGDFERRPDILRALKDLQNGDESFRPPIEDIAKKAGVTLDQARRVLQAPRLDSLSNPIGDGSSTVADVVEEPGDSMEDRIIDTMQVRTLETYGMSLLDSRELYVLIRRMGLDREPKQRLSAIGDVLGLSREAVRQIESKAKAKLQHPVALRAIIRGE